MKKLFILGMGLLLALAAFIPDQATAGQDGCNACAVIAPPYKNGRWHITLDGSCKYGHAERNVPGWGHRELDLYGTSDHGPDCHVVMTKKNEKGDGVVARSVYRIQQNLCRSKAGKITVEYIEGVPLDYQKLTGSWAGECGMVDFDEADQ